MISTTIDKFWTYIDSCGLLYVYSDAFNSADARYKFFMETDPSNWINEMPAQGLTDATALQMVSAKAGWLDVISRVPFVSSHKTDNVNHPAHYTSHPSGVEVIRITEHMGFCLGNAVKYIMRCDEKGAAIEDLKKAVWYLEREIAKRESNQ